MLGFVFVWGVMICVFFGFFVLGIVFKVVVDLFGLGNWDSSLGSGLFYWGVFGRIRSAYWNFFFVFGVGCLFLFGASHFIGWGLDIWF